jgi:MFS family permease
LDAPGVDSRLVDGLHRRLRREPSPWRPEPISTSASQAGNGYSLALALLYLVGGAAGDRTRHRRVFLWGVVGFALVSALAGLAATGAFLSQLMPADGRRPSA